MLYPLTFHPIFQERIWGGRNLESLYAKKLPAGKIIGEAWEISDRPEANSVISNGPLAGKSLAEIMSANRNELMGRARAPEGRFPLLVKLLDAQANLSLQVHPPAQVASSLGGCAKTEMWYVSAAEEGAMLYAGLRRGVNRGEFEEKIRAGSVAECFHRLPARAGDSLFLPSGRVHAIGAGLVIFEIQQNSDTTYRVFDWNRVDSSGKPRPLHIEESLKSIDFEDFEPRLTDGGITNAGGGVMSRALARHALFAVDLFEFAGNSELHEVIGEPRVIGVVSGRVTIPDENVPVTLGPGEFALVPASAGKLTIQAPGKAKLLIAAPG